MNCIRNKVQLIGQLGQAPDIKEIGGGRKVANLSLVTNEVCKTSKGEKITDTQWHSVIVWGKLAEAAERYLVKGVEIAIEGKLVTRHFIDKKGNHQLITEVQANQLLILSKR